jgi:hypothetical protein
MYFLMNAKGQYMTQFHAWSDERYAAQFSAERAILLLHGHPEACLMAAPKPVTRETWQKAALAVVGAATIVLLMLAAPLMAQQTTQTPTQTQFMTCRKLVANDFVSSSESVFRSSNGVGYVVCHLAPPPPEPKPPIKLKPAPKKRRHRILFIIPMPKLW